MLDLYILLMVIIPTSTIAIFGLAFILMLASGRQVGHATNRK